MKTETTKRERINHVARVNIDLANDLLMYKAKRNFDLQGTGLFCNLRPNKSKEACATCSNYKKCMKARKERAFIHQKMDAVSCKRRRRKQDNPRKRVDPEWINEKDESEIPFDSCFIQTELYMQTEEEFEELCEMLIPEDEIPEDFLM